MSEAQKSRIPDHVGIILDGNRRWAKSQNKPTLEGHRQGAEVFKEISLNLFDRGVSYLSAYVFSTENWKRAEEEVNYLMNLVVKAVELHLEEFNKRGIKIVVLGKRDDLSKTVLKAIEKTEQKTSNNSQGTLALCFNYGGRSEIVGAVKSIVEDGIDANEISEESITERLYYPEVPDVDLLIRTSGELRVSGFMLWRISYAEFCFVEKYWPELTVKDVDKILKEYSDRDRRFGC